MWRRHMEWTVVWSPVTTVVNCSALCLLPRMLHCSAVIYTATGSTTRSQQWPWTDCACTQPVSNHVGMVPPVLNCAYNAPFWTSAYAPFDYLLSAFCLTTPTLYYGHPLWMTTSEIWSTFTHCCSHYSCCHYCCQLVSPTSIFGSCRSQKKTPEDKWSYFLQYEWIKPKIKKQN